jgi:hypothetical protein
MYVSEATGKTVIALAFYNPNPIERVTREAYDNRLTSDDRLTAGLAFHTLFDSVQHTDFGWYAVDEADLD